MKYLSFSCVLFLSFGIISAVDNWSTWDVNTNNVGINAERIDYQCPAGFILRGTQCWNPLCEVTPTTTTRPIIRNCIVTPIVIPGPDPAPKIITCPPGSYLVNNQCVSVNVRIICPTGTLQEGNTCVYRVEGNGPIGVEVRCPPNTVKDPTRNVCIYQAESTLTLSVECPPNTERRGNTCVMLPVPIQFRCSDGSMPVNGFCTITAQGSVVVRCPAGSRNIGGNVCEVIPPVVRYVCPDGTPAIGGTCTTTPGPGTVPVPDVIYECPLGSVMDSMNRCIFRVQGGVPPSIDFNCPPNTEKRGNVCVVNLGINPPKVKFICPSNAEQVDEKTCLYRIPPADFDFYCPSGYERQGNKCFHTITTDRCSDRHETFGGDCPTSVKGGGEGLVHNNNTIHAPTNVTSSNVQHINISISDCGNGAKERIIMTNGKTERIPCPVQPPVRVPVHVPQPYPVHVPVPQPVSVPQPMPMMMMPQQTNCCTVQTQQCSAPNMCQYVPQQRCGGYCR